MSVVSYCAILRGKTVIAAMGDQSASAGKDLVKLLPPASSRIEQKITTGRLYTFFTTPLLTFVAISPQSVDKQKPIAFLDTIARRWSATYGNVSASATEHSLDSVFAKNFQAALDECNKENKAADLNRRLDETQQILTESMTKVVDRGAHLDAIASKSEELRNTSEEFRTQATNLKWKMRCQYIKSWAMWILMIILILYFILSWFCGGWKLGRCF